MREPSGEHLGQEDFERLALSAASAVQPVRESTRADSSLVESDETAGASALRHIESCDACRRKASLYQAVTMRLNELKTEGVATAESDCPPASEWPMVAAGIISSEEAREYLRHAAQCDHCGMLMRQATTAFEDEFTAEEEQSISQLKSSQSTWQEEFARELSVKSQVDVAPSTKSPAREPKRSWIAFPRWQPWAYGAAAALVVAAILFQLFSTYYSRTPDKLLAQAYAEQRNLELRFSGAQYGPVRVERGRIGESRLNKSPALLEAEALIAQKLQKEPNSPVWLQSKGRADLLDGNYEAAIQSFQKALEIQPDSVSLQTDAASAYFQRAELADRVGDFGKAIELLSRALEKKPDDPIARFNRALVNERMFLFRQAVEDWEYYLRIDSKGDWANEANQHLNGLRQKLSEQERSATDPPLDPAAFLKETGRPDDPVRRRIEDYLDIAIREWLPTAFRDHANYTDDVSRVDVIRRALERLAERLSTDHHDQWLSDMLAAPPSNGLSRAIPVLAEAVIANATGDFALAETSSVRAQQLFQDGGSVAGKSRAQLETIYALDRSGHGQRCLFVSDQLAGQPQAYEYPWIETQLLLERSNCLSQMGRFSEAQKAIEMALALAGKSGYPTLHLRALGIAAALQMDQGNTAAAGSLDRDGLRRYWEGGYPPIRAYQFYADLGYPAEKSEQWHFALALAKEAVSAIALSPQRLGEAFARHRLAKTALIAGDQALAFSEFDRANALFAALPQTEVTTNYQADGEIELARLDAERGDLDQSWARLSSARKKLLKTTRYFTALNFFKTRGELHNLNGDRVEAEKAFRAAVAVTERGLVSLRDEHERAVWARETSQVYRALAQTKWESNDIEGALGVWEWYRGAALRTHTGSAQPPISPTRPQTDNINLASLEAGPALPALPLRHISDLTDKTVLVYLQLPKDLIIWVVDDSGVTGKRVSVSQEELVRLVRRFSEECGNPNSDLAALQRDARQLYDLLINPISDRLAEKGLRTLVIETDQAIAEIPIAALLDPAGRYLGESYDIVFSRGLLYRQLLRSPAGFSSGERALIVGSPALSGSLVASLEPLGDALQEAQYVASKFKVSTLLTGGRATLETVQHELPQSEVFHFAGHALIRSEHVGLLLANPQSQDDAEAGETAILDSDSLASLNLRRLQLAVFSACSTGRDRNPGESSSESLVNLFLRAGVSQVLATRWNVDSRITARYMQIFYDRLLSDESVTSSVGAASVHLRAHADTQHPYYWAAFAVFGQ